VVFGMMYAQAEDDFNRDCVALAISSATGVRLV